MALERILDQPRAVDLLRRALASDRVAHAYAFIGPAGAGRMTTALAFAEELLASPARLHPDLHVIVPTPPEKRLVTSCVGTVSLPRRMNSPPLMRMPEPVKLTTFTPKMELLLEVMSKRCPLKWWQDYRAMLEKRFRQDEIVIRMQSIKVV